MQLDYGRSGDCIDRRVLRRVPVTLPVLVGVDDNVIVPCTVCDLSASGVRIASGTRLPERQQLVILLKLDDEERADHLFCEGWVVRTEPDAAGAYRYGVEFGALTPELCGRLDGFIARQLAMESVPRTALFSEAS